MVLLLKLLPTIKDRAAVNGMTAQASPIVGVYTASVRPTIKPPPTKVAAESTTQAHMEELHRDLQAQVEASKLILPTDKQLIDGVNTFAHEMKF